MEAAKPYLSEEYIHHNPHVVTGRAAFIEALKDAFKDEKERHSKNIFKRTIADDDLVVLHSHKIKFEGDRGVAGSIFFERKIEKSPNIGM